MRNGKAAVTSRPWLPASLRKHEDIPAYLQASQLKKATDPILCGPYNYSETPTLAEYTDLAAAVGTGSADSRARGSPCGGTQRWAARRWRSSSARRGACGGTKRGQNRGSTKRSITRDNIINLTLILNHTNESITNRTLQSCTILWMVRRRTCGASASGCRITCVHTCSLRWRGP